MPVHWQCSSSLRRSRAGVIWLRAGMLRNSSKVKESGVSTGGDGEAIAGEVGGHEVGIFLDVARVGRAVRTLAWRNLAGGIFARERLIGHERALRCVGQLVGPFEEVAGGVVAVARKSNWSQPERISDDAPAAPMPSRRRRLTISWLIWRSP